MTTSPLSAERSALVLADLLPGARIRDVLLVGGYALLIAAGAQVAFPLPGTPVPVTAQTFVVLLGAASLGTVRAAGGGALFLGLGLLGVPWFAASSGATVGYLVGFVAAAAVVGWAARRGWLASTRGAVSAFVLAELAILGLGTLGLILVVGLSLPAAIAAGVAPFLIGDALKLAAATALLPPVQRHIAA